MNYNLLIMKKVIISFGLCLCVVFAAMAQDMEEGSVNQALVNKRGIALLPEAGDFALGIDANPILNYLGGFMGGRSTSGSYGIGGFDETIYGKYFLQDNAAVRVKLNLNFTQYKEKGTPKDDYATVNDPTNVAATTVDTRIRSNNFVDLAIGYEMRRGKGRVQGFYGAELNLGYGGNITKFEYGNPLTEANQNPTTTWWYGTPSQGYRYLENKYGPQFNAGLGGFVGVEYFFAPQISIGGEFSLRLSYFIQGQTEVTAEGFLNGKVHEYKYRERYMYDTAFDAGLQTRTWGNIFLMFHF